MYTREWTVRFSDTDSFGIAHYPRIVDAFQETADMFMESVGHPFWEIQTSFGVGLPVGEVNVTFDRPLESGDVVEFELSPSVGTTSVTFEYTGRVDGTVHFAGQERRVCVDVDDGEPTPLPDALREALTR